MGKSVSGRYRAVLYDFKEAYEKWFGDTEETNISEAYCLVEDFLQMQNDSYADDLDIPQSYWSL